MDDQREPCPCGCGAVFVRMVAEREAGLRADAAAGRVEPVLKASNRPRIFLLSGMPGAGKSTVARQLAERFDMAAHIDLDMVFHHFTVAGLVAPNLQDDRALAQERLSVLNAAAMARNYADAGFVCVVEGAVARREAVRAFAQAVHPHGVHLVVLAPPVAVSEARDAARTGKHVADAFRYLEPLLHTELAGVGLWLDTSEMTASATVSAILEREERSTLAAT